MSGGSVDFTSYQELQEYVQVMDYEHKNEGGPIYTDIIDSGEFIESLEKKFLEREVKEEEKEKLEKIVTKEKRKKLLNH